MIVRVLSLSFVALIAACSSSGSSSNSTTTVTPKTIDGVCTKINSLSCAPANCKETLELGQQRCGDAQFQGLLDCMAIAKISCGGPNNLPEAPQCDSDIQRVNVCASDAGPYNGGGDSTGNNGSNGGLDAGRGGFDAALPSDTCTSVAQCTDWPCMCQDGTQISISECKGGKCTDPSALCTPGNAVAEGACKDHGGVL